MERRRTPRPHKFEAGTPPIAEAVAFGAAIDYLSALGMDRVAEHEVELTTYALTADRRIHGLTIIGPKARRASGAAVSFTLDEIHPHDVGQVLDYEGIAVRVGHHCAGRSASATGCLRPRGVVLPVQHP